MTEIEAKKLICEIGHRIWNLGFVAANDGNISCRLEDGNFLATPTGVSKSLLTPEMIVKVDAEGNVLEANDGYKPSSEVKMHLVCYKERPDVNAVVHAHPPTATGFAIANIPLDDYSMPEAIIFIGSVPIAKYGTPSTNEIPDSVVPFLQEHDCILLQNHGALTVGIDLWNAYYRMETLEHFAKVTLVARQLGGVQELTKEQIDKCIDLRKTFKVSGKHCGYKKFSK